MNSTDKLRRRLEVNKWLLLILLCIIGYFGLTDDSHIFSLVTQSEQAHAKEQGDISSPYNPPDVVLPDYSYKHRMNCQNEVLLVSEGDIYIPEVSYSVLTVPPVKSISFDNSSVTALLSMSENYRLQIFDDVEYKSSVEFRRIHQGAVRFCNQKHSRTIVAGNEYPIIPATSIPVLYIRITDTPPMHSNEEYTLDISESMVEIAAPSHLGALHALSTLAQLLHSNVPIQLPISISDHPDQSWRGLLLDVARHFIPVEQIRGTIDAMSDAKLNVLHLHLTDSQSFPVLLDDVRDLPLSQLARRGAFRSSAYSFASRNMSLDPSSPPPRRPRDAKYIYTLDDLKSLVLYAQERGIDIIPELDVPAHALSWSHAFPDIVVSCPKYAATQDTPANIPTLNPISNLTMQVIHHVIAQLAEVFTSSPYLHIGGDEIAVECWREEPALVAYAAEKKITLTEVLRQFEVAVFDTVRGLGKVPMAWQGIVDQGIFPQEPTPSPTSGNLTSSPSTEREVDHTRAIVEPWKCWGGLAGRAASNAAKEGHSVVTAACWYLDFDSDFDDFFNVDPIAVAIANTASGVPAAGSATIRRASETRSYLRSGGHTGSATIRYRHLTASSYQQIVLGAEAAIWTEHVDYTNLECRLWPRTAAMAMHMWGYRHLADSNFKYINYNRNSPGRALLLSYVLFRDYLWRFRRVKAADITLHEVVESMTTHTDGDDGIPKQSLAYKAVQFGSTAELLSYVDASSTSLTPQGTLVMPCKITSQCKGFKADIQRPIGNPLKIAQLNTADGAPAGRRDLLLQWLTMQANAGVDVIGFCEANGWNSIESNSKTQDNFPIIRGLAAGVGYAYSHVLHSDTHPYNIALMSSHPFTVVGEYGPPLYERGLLHAYVDDLRLHVLVAHLNAHSSQDREVETRHIASIVKPLLVASERVVVMGDMNTLFRGDKLLHDAEGLLQLFHRTDYPVFPRLLKKIASPDGTAINYKPLDNLVDVGLIELCASYCSGFGLDYEESGMANINSCMATRCAATEPTKYNPEWPKIPGLEIMPKMRLDFIFASESLISTDVEVSSGVVLADTGIENNNITENLSDHFPVHATWGYI